MTARSNPLLEPDDSGGAAAPAQDTGSLRALKIAVIVMGVVLVLGFITVIARIIYLVSRPPAQQASSGAGLAAEQRLELPDGAIVRSQSLSGNRLAVHYEAPGGAGIAVLDLETGRTISRVRLVPALPGR